MGAKDSKRDLTAPICGRSYFAPQNLTRNTRLEKAPVSLERLIERWRAHSSCCVVHALHWFPRPTIIRANGSLSARPTGRRGQLTGRGFARPKVNSVNMASSMELSCWGGDWGLPSVHAECLVVMTYARFSGAPLKISVIDNEWKAQRGSIPLLLSDDIAISEPAKILNFLRKQKYNADYELSSKEGADTLAYIALLEEKLHPAMLYTFWIEADNYYNLTKPWFASRIPFPLSWYLPRKMSREALNRILLTKGGPPLYSITEVEVQIYRDAKECLNLLSNRLGSAPFFFGNKPTTLDAFVFGFLAPLYKAPFLKVQLQEHLKQLPNLCRFCDDILSCYFRRNLSGTSPEGQETVDANLQKLTQLVNKESNLIEKMDDNLRKSPQHPPRKLTTVKLSTAEEGNNSLNRLSPL